MGLGELGAWVLADKEVSGFFSDGVGDGGAEGAEEICGVVAGVAEGAGDDPGLAVEKGGIGVWGCFGGNAGLVELCDEILVVGVGEVVEDGLCHGVSNFVYGKEAVAGGVAKGLE